MSGLVGRDQSMVSRRGRTAKACQLCNRRKVRCDRKEPSCSPCLRASKPCVYPTPTSTPDTLLGTTNATPVAVSWSSPDIEGAAESQSDRASDNRSVTEVLLQQGPATQYFDDTLHLTAVEEGKPFSGPTSHQRSTLFSLSTLVPFLPPVLQPTTGWHPPRPLAHVFWSTYVDNVESCSNRKVLHIPTDEVRFFTTLDKPLEASYENSALNFAIYFASLSSLDIRGLSPSHYLQRQDLEHDLNRFKVGVEQSLARADFMNKPTTVILKAFAIYLTTLQVSRHGMGTWALSGLAIRLCQAIGLHRDGERLGLSPFESEIRRRLWWHFVIRDSRSGEDQGLQHVTNLVSTFKITKPLNLDDIDIFPEMQELPQERRGFTSMTFTKINIAFAEAQRKLASLLSLQVRPFSELERERAEIIATMVAHVDEGLVMCNMTIPRHRLLILISRFVQEKLDLTSRLQLLTVKNEKGSSEAIATDENLETAVSLLERFSSILTDEVLEPYAWSTRAFPQTHILLYVLWHLCVRPNCSVSSRAWEVLNSICTTMWDSVRQNSDSMGQLVDALAAKAALVGGREETLGYADHDNMQTFDLDSAVLRTTQDQAALLVEPQSLSRDHSLSNLLLGNDPMEVPDWAMILENLD